MSNVEHIFGDCGTHFTYPEDITEKIRAYLLANEYKQINHGEDVKRYIKGLEHEILLYNRPTSRDSYFATITINKIAAHERRSFGSVLRDILYDNEDKVKFLKGQLTMFGKCLQRLQKTTISTGRKSQARLHSLKSR